MKIINLSNIKIQKNSINLEFLYKSEIIDDNSVFYLEDINNKQYICEFYKCKDKVNYTYNDEEDQIAKVSISIDIQNYGFLKIFIKDSQGITELNIQNNKNEEISNSLNPYIIFYNNYKVEMLNNGFVFTPKQFGDKFRYELKKYIYGLKKYHKLFSYRLLKSKNRKYYLFNDRLLYGDDNAEVLFKYINENKTGFAKNCYFVLDKKSKRFSEIKKIGKVLKYGGFWHKVKFLNSRMVISSHASYLSNCFNPFSIEEMDIYKDLINKNFVFLQHGVIMNDVRQYLNRELITADLFVTSTHKEYKYISSEDYMYDSNMVIPTGLPRFDRLKDNHSKVILISPTWRAYDENFKFEDTDYYKQYRSLLENERLLALLDNNCEIRAEYKSKIEDTFIYLDNNNSKRVFDEIIKLDEIDEINYRFNNVH